jgi:hypothetical protein
VNNTLINIDDEWYVKIIPYDGENTGTPVFSKIVSIISAPSIWNVTYTVPSSSEGGTEGLYNIWVITNDTTHLIDRVEVVLDLNLQIDPEVGNYIAQLIVNKYTARSSVSSNTWLISNIDILPPGDRTIFSSLIGKTVVVQVFVFIEINDTTLNTVYSVWRLSNFNITILDEASPTVKDVVIKYDNDLNPKTVTFYVEVEEYGSGVKNGILYYFFEQNNENMNTSSLQFTKFRFTQSFDIPDYFESITLVSFNNSFYFATVDISLDTSFLIHYQIVLEDQAGNVNPNAWPSGRSAPEELVLTVPGLPLELVLGVILLIILFAIVFTFIGIKKFRSTEIVGLDVDKVMEEARKIPWEEIDKNLDEHSMGIIISTFDQSHGPIPIFVHPDMLKDNIDKLIDLSDRSFSSTRFIENFDKEIQTMFEYDMTPTLNITSISFGYSLNRPNLRGGAENITMNILMHKPFETIIAQFLKVISPDIHEIHRLMDQEPDQKSQIQEKIRIIRKTVSSIVLAYEKLYEDMPIEELE